MIKCNMEMKVSKNENSGRCTFAWLEPKLRFAYCNFVPFLSITLSITFMTWSNNFSPRCYLFLLLSQSEEIFPYFIIAFAQLVNKQAPVMPADCSISPTIPDGPAAFPDFILAITLVTISTKKIKI